MPDIRLIATDIDGTLANDAGELTSETRRVLQVLLDRGIPVVLVTGLNPWTAGRFVSQIGHGVRAISLNGIFLLEDEEVHEGRFVPQDVAREAAEIMVANGYIPLTYGADGVERYLPSSPGEPALARLIAERPYQPFVPVSSVDELFSQRVAVVSVCDTDARARLLYPKLEDAIGERTYLVYQPGLRRTWIEVNHPEARKDTALLALADRLNVTPDQIVYFGDSLNDLVVFRSIPHCVAMGNALPEVTALAWRVARTNQEDGVARFLITLFGLQGLP